MRSLVTADLWQGSIGYDYENDLHAGLKRRRIQYLQS